MSYPTSNSGQQSFPDDRRSPSNSRSNSGSVINNYSGHKRLGTYLVEAKLLAPAHIELALRDQSETGYRLGDILVLRGWVKRELVEWIVEHKLLPERQSLENRKIENARKNVIINPKDEAFYEGETVIIKPDFSDSTQKPGHEQKGHRSNFSQKVMDKGLMFMSTAWCGVS